VTQTVKGYLAYSWQLTADSFYLLTAFLTTAADPSHPLRMTINIPLIMTPFLPIVILNGARMLFGKDGKRNGETE
jgi:hypothetical protein